MEHEGKEIHNQEFNPLEDWSPEINSLSPELLSNTAFIYTPPKKLKPYFVNKFKAFIGHYNLTISEFDEMFFKSIGIYHKWQDVNYNPRLITAQSVLTRMYEYDKKTSFSKKDRIFKYKCPNLKDKLYSKIISFSRRHGVAEFNISKEFLGDDKILYLFRMGKISLSLSKIDSLFYEMHLEDLALISDMGDKFDKWAGNNGINFKIKRDK